MNRIKLAVSALFLFAAMATQSSAQINGGTVGTTRPQVYKVTSVGLSAYGTGASGTACPKGAMIIGGITTDGPCTVQYQWIYSWKPAGPVETMTFTAAGNKTTSVSFSTATEQTPNFSGTIKLKVISPNAIESATQSITASCSNLSLPPGGVIIKP
jgi:hypothetical protein